MSQQMCHIYLLFLLGLSKTWTLPVPPTGTSDEIVFVEEMVQYADLTTSSTATLITQHSVSNGNGDDVGLSVAVVATTEAELHQDNESILDTSAGASDDLIFITAKKRNHLQEQQHQQKAHHRSIHQIDLLTVEDISPFSAESSSSASCETEMVVDDVADADDVAGNAPHEIQLYTDDWSTQQAPRPTIDMRDFVALIPADEVKTIVANYYRNDPEVQRAYVYLSGREFAELKKRIIRVPEMSAFLRYLNASGLDVVGFLHTLTNLTNKPNSIQYGTDEGQANALGRNEMNKILLPATTAPTLDALLSTTMTLATKNTIETTTTSSESLNGLHGLVDSILDILPQDQILSAFFDKLETSEQFSKLVDNIGSPEFTKILHNMENSVPLRNLIFTLHNHGIYITRIVDSLKAYFFLGTF